MAKVTVLMPVYNVAPYINETVQSVLSQTFSNFILLVINDCSTDNTLSILESIDDSRIKIVNNRENLGLTKTLNKGLSLIDTEYVSRMDGDDIAEPYWLEKELKVLEDNKEIGVCGGGFEWFGSKHGKVIYPKMHDNIVANMLFGCTIIVPTFRMSLFKNMHLQYEENAFPAEDYHFWAKCLRVTKLYNIPEVLFHYRMHEQQICSSKQEIQQLKVKDIQEYMLNWLSPELSTEEITYFTNVFAPGCITSKEDYIAFKHFSRNLLDSNNAYKRISPTALRIRINQHLKSALYLYIIKRYFSTGYSLTQYYEYILSGLAFRVNCKLEIKILIKSILCFAE